MLQKEIADSLQHTSMNVFLGVEIALTVSWGISRIQEYMANSSGLTSKWKEGIAFSFRELYMTIFYDQSRFANCDWRIRWSWNYSVNMLQYLLIWFIWSIPKLTWTWLLVFINNSLFSLFLMLATDRNSVFVAVVKNNVFISCYYCSFRRYGFSRQAGKTEQVKNILILNTQIVGRVALFLLNCWLL